MPDKDRTDSDTPFRRALAKHFDKFKKFTNEIFKETKLKADSESDELRPAASDDEHLNSSLIMRRQYSREVALSRRKNSKRRCAEMQPK